MHGNGVPAGDANDLSVVLVVECGGFRAELGGDLGGYDRDGRRGIESSVAYLLGRLNFHLVHQHGSATGTSEPWLEATSPQVAVLSVGSNP